MTDMQAFVLASPLIGLRREMLLAESVIRTLRWPSNVTLTHISPAAYAKLHEAIHCAMKNQGDVMCGALFRLLEAYLALTGNKLGIYKDGFDSVNLLVDFVGALYSRKFLHADLATRYKWTYGWRAALKYACPDAYSQIPSPSTIKTSEWFDKAAVEFEGLVLDSRQVDLWRGWPIPKFDGKIAWPDLRKIYERYGKEFAEEYAVALAAYAAGRKINGLTTETAFSDFIADLPAEWRKEDFSSYFRLSSILIEFLIYLYKSYDEAENQYSTLANDWKDFVQFAISHVCTGKFFAKLSKDDFPALPSKDSSHGRTHRRTNSNGETYIAKLLTDIPLHLSDEDAVELIYGKIEAHLDLVKGWAESEVDALWTLLKRRQQLAEVGQVKEVLSQNLWDGRTALIDRENPEWKANACATFQFHGFRMRREGKQRMLYPSQLGNIAFDVLALPVSGALIPHLTLLVIEHPQLTPSFLENLRLFDKNDQISGVTETDSGWLLDGDKFRRGPENSEQQIHLSDRSAEIVAQIVEITQPLRDYLRRKNDPNWRYLLLTCGKGFSYPSRMRISHTTTHFRNTGGLKERFLADGKMPDVEACTLAARFSLVTVRATVGVVAYIREPDIQKLANLLGHKKLDIRLLERYLPAPLMRYFEERWVRLFQCGILVEALKGSKYLQPSVGFKSLHELNQFVSNHALKWAPRQGPAAEAKAGHLFDSVVFSISEEILMLLVGVHEAVANAERPVSKLAEMWADYAEKLFAYIDGSTPPRDDFRTMLASAKKKDCSDLISPGAIYA